MPDSPPHTQGSAVPSTATKALLIYPPTGVYDRTDRCQTPIDFTASQPARPPLDLMYMAGGLQSVGVTCLIRDYPVEKRGWAALVQDIESFRPDYCIISITSFSFYQDMKAARIAKAMYPEIIVIAKGAHFKKNATEIIEEHPELDIAITGESEWVPAEIITKKRTEVPGIVFRDEIGHPVENDERPILRELDELPAPARELINHAHYRLPDNNRPYTTILAARGCPFSCIYCLVPSVSGKTISTRSPQSMVKEIKECYETWDIQDYLLKADTFTLNQTWVREFCQLLNEENLPLRWFTNTRPDTINAELARDMKKAGCWMLAMGVESGDETILEKIGKKTTRESIKKGVDACREAQLQTFLYFTIGLPWDTRVSIKRSIKFALELDGDYVEFHPIYPFPGSAIYKIGREHQLFEEQNSADDIVRPDTFLRTFTLTIQQINRLRIEGLIRFYLRPKKLRRILAKYEVKAILRLSCFAIKKLLISIYQTALKPLKNA